MTKKKDSNPKDAVGIRKVPWSTLSAPVIGELGLAVLEGARKYGRHNWRGVGVRASVYYDAVVARHLAAWWEGEDVDPESGLSHLSKAMAGLHVLRDAQMRGMMEDDRPPGTIGFIAVQNGMAADIIDRHPVAEEPITHKDAPAVEYFNGDPPDDPEITAIVPGMLGMPHDNWPGNITRPMAEGDEVPNDCGYEVTDNSSLYPMGLPSDE